MGPDSAAFISFLDARVSVVDTDTQGNGTPAIAEIII